MDRQPMPKPSPSNKISKAERTELWDLIQYLNLAEMERFCKQHELPRYILLETEEGQLRRSKDRDRKDIVLARLFEFALSGRRLPPTVYRAEVIRESPLGEELSSRTRMHYGQYEKQNPALSRLLKELTGGRYRHGMISRLVLRDFWSASRVPTLAQFAKAWIAADEAHVAPRPEGAYLADLARGTGREGWKAMRVRKAKQALKILARRTAT